MSGRVVHCKREPYDVYIGRGSKWGNPFVIGTDGTREEVIAKYRAYLATRPGLIAALPELSGKVLGCWCSPKACHGDILVELSNGVPVKHTDFEFAAGGTLGRDHRLGVHNYQDAYLITQHDHCTVGVVTDGCSSGSAPDSSHNELGARIGAHFIARALVQQCVTEGEPGGFIDWDRVAYETVAQLTLLGIGMEGRSKQIIQDHFLFTITGVVLRDIGATFFALGDGLALVNGKPYGAQYDNRPPYLGYKMLAADRLEGIDPEDLEIKLLERMPLESLDHFLIGSDGVNDLGKARGKNYPGMDREIPEITQFWENDRFFNGNPDLVSRELRLVGRDWPRTSPQPGLLPDDTTLIVGRRCQQPQP